MAGIVSKRKERARRNSLLWMGGAAAAAVVLVGIVIWANAGAGEQTVSALDDCAKPTCGKANAPVAVEIFSDFQ